MAITNIKKTGGTLVIPILSANIDNIDFTNIPGGGKGTQGKTFWNDKANINVWKDGGDGTQWKPSVNAVDIDWNGAVVGENKTLNTTGEVLSMLKEAYNTAKNAQPKGDYLTSIPDEYVTETELSNKGYLTAVPSGYVTETELNAVIKTLSDRITALENNKIYEVKSVTLTNLRCDVLSSAKTIPATGGTFTITANSGYSLPNDVTVTGATSSWNKSTGVLTISNVTGEVTVSASGIANVPTAIAFKSTSGTDLTSCEITGQNGAQQFKVVPSNNKGLITSQSKVVFTDIPSQFGIYNGNTKLSANTPYDSSITFTVKATSKTNGLITVKADKASSITDTLSITVKEGSVSKVDITTSDTKTSTYKGGNVTIALSVSETMFATPTISWSSDGGELQNKSISGATFVAPENTTTSDKVYTITAKYSDTLKDSMMVTVPAKPEDKKYYWYVGNKSPEGMTPPSIGNANSKLCTWTSIGTSLPTNQIKVYKGDEINYDDHTWYVAAPYDSNYVLYNGTGVASNEAAFNISNAIIGGIKYKIWTSKGVSDQVVGYLKR